ncbi:unnamed protein product [Diabrotica balteata]|uniref:Uncharacterized protein n=1 Tax=Diabrotica balteata TaxID=107213 RepID=A0A9N9X7Y4_DIABA|nr:unnamed protein product [Diabrotica balteata]
MISQIENKLEKYEYEMKGYLQQIQKEVDRIAEETDIKLESQRKEIHKQIETVEEKTRKKIQEGIEKVEWKLERALQEDKVETKKEIKEIQKTVEEIEKELLLGKIEKLLYKPLVTLRSNFAGHKKTTSSDFHSNN